MTVFEAVTIMIAFGTFVVALIAVIIALTQKK